MSGRASAYAALGLEPGADRSAVEQAYRRLIKLHHPDRSGGDAGRATEINRAYFELRQPAAAEPPKVDRPRRARRAASRRPTDAHIGQRTRARRSRLWPILLMAAAAGLVANRERLVEQWPRWIGWLADWQAPVVAGGHDGAVQADSALLDGPLADAAIAAATSRAVRLTRQRDEAGLIEHSRACHRQLRVNPDLAALDRCAAFDDAVAALSDRDPMRDDGPFSASAVTARQMSAASLLSSDYLAIEHRLDRIRSLVEITLRPPPLPSSPKPPVVAEPAPDEPGALPEN
jgi:DnaJ domain